MSIHGLGTLCLLVGALWLTGCGEPIPAPDQVSDVPVGIPGAGVPARAMPAIQTAGVRDRPCEALTPRMVSDVMRVPVQQLQGVTVAGSCTYAWDEGDNWQRGSAALTDFRVFIEEDDAVRYFEQTYRSLTPEELAEMEGRLAEERQAALQTGQVTEEELAQAEGGTVTALNLEEVQGIGDQARYDGTLRLEEVPQVGQVRIAESTLYVRSGTVVMGVRADRSSPATIHDARRGPTDQEWRNNRDLTLRLAQRVLSGR